ncbi:MAG: hypothetical protein AB7U20_17975 [Planctomycetaceae bacterium]
MLERRSIDGPLTARKIADAVLTAIEMIPNYDDAFLAMISEEAASLDFKSTRVHAGLEKDAAELERQIDNFMAFIREGDRSQRVRDELERLEVELNRVNGRMREFEDSPTGSIVIPPISELKLMARQAFGDLASDHPEIGRLMRLLIPKIADFPCRLYDGKKIVMRAKFRLQLSRLLPDKRTQDILLHPLEQIRTVDLFDHPQREKHRQRIADLRQTGVTEAGAATICGITRTAAQNAMRLHRKMRQLGLDDPYVPVTEPPEDSKLSRHHHHRYRFDPLDDAGQF